jgi:hypothetical protein
VRTTQAFYKFSLINFGGGLLLWIFLSKLNIDFGSELSDAAIKRVAIDGGLGTGGSTPQSSQLIDYALAIGEA